MKKSYQKGCFGILVRIFIKMKLFEKLIQRKVPMCFVRILKHWYKEQTMQIKWGKHFSEPFHVSNGVRQG